MEDVIFAGTSGRPPLGRAEVHADHRQHRRRAADRLRRGHDQPDDVPQRRLGVRHQRHPLPAARRPGAAVSDSGIGREMHVIVGQGQLDTILHATPEDRRGFIEEAAGVLKHRKRKEKALRKLDSTEGNLTRLSDLLSEIRRQLKPLGRQAEVARRAADRAGRRPRRPGPAARRRPGHRPDRARAGARRRDGPGRAPRARSRPRSPAARDARPPSRRRCARTCRRWPRPRRPGSRCPACASGCAAPRAWPPSGSATPPAPPRPAPSSGRDPDELEAEAERVRGQEQRDRAPRSTRTGPRSRRPSPPAGRPRTRPPRRSAGSPGCCAPPPTAARAWPGCTARSTRCSSRAAAAEDEIGRLEPGPRGRRRPRRAGPARLHRPRDPGRRPRRRRGGPRRRARGRRRRPRRHRRSGSPRPARRPSRPTATGPRSAARKDALEMGLNRKDGAGALLAASDAGLRPARLGRRAAHRARRLRGRRRRRARLGRRRGRRRPTPTPPSARSATSRTTTSAAPGCCSAADPATDRDWPGAARPARRTPSTSWSAPTDAASGALTPAAVQDRRRRRPRAPPARWSPSCPDVTAVTRDGDLLGAHFAAGGSAAQPSLIEVQAAVDEADRPAGRGGRGRASGSGSTWPGSRPSGCEAQQRVDVALAKLHESDATLAAVAEELGQYGSQARAARGEAERLAEAIAQAEEARDHDLAGLAELEARLAVGRGRPGARSPTPPSASGSPRPPAPPGRPRWTPGWRCAPPRSGPARCTAAPTSWSAPPRPSARPAPGPPSAASG